MLSYLTVQPKRHSPLDQNSDKFCVMCGYQNPDSAWFCLNCATALAATCPACRHQATAGNRFCAKCGAQLSAASPDSQPDKRGLLVLQEVQALVPKPLANKISVASDDIFGERREVTALWITFVDRDGIAIDDETLFFIKDDGFKQLVTVIDEYEGTVDTFTHDGLVAIFGAPAAHENDPERAVRAALEIRSAINPWQLRIEQETGLHLDLSIGINTGLVVVGNVGSQQYTDYTIIGDTMRLTAALREAAKPGTILVGETTYQRVWSRFEFQDHAPLLMAGRSQPVRVFRPLRVLDQPTPSRFSPQLSNALIGRASELVHLQSALKEVTQHEQSRIALITGEAGLGKSRLVVEFCRIAARVEAQTYQGECVTYARSTPLWVVTAILRHSLDLPETTLPAVQQQLLRDKLDQLNLTASDIEPYLAHILGIESNEAQTRLNSLDAAMLQQQTHAALRQFFLTMAREKPLVLIFENLHQIDPASRDFLEYLIRSDDDAPLLLILVARSAERKTKLRPLIEAAQQSGERLLDIQLKPLSNEEARLLVNQRLTDNSRGLQPLKDQIVRRAEGNPLFIEEIINMLVDQGGIRREPTTNAWVVTAQAAGLLNAIPKTITGLILARFDRLPEGMRRTLHKASVFGTAFPLTLLQTISDLVPEAATAQLEELVARQFLVSQSFHTTTGYAFCHTLLQETIYETLIRRDRQKLHAQVAQVIELSALWLPEEQAEILAYHYAESHLPMRALPYLLTAGTGAARRCAYETAIKHFRQAINISPSRPEKNQRDFFRIKLGLGNSLKFIGELSAAGEILAEVIQELWHSSLALDPDPLQEILIESLYQLADVRQREGAYDAARHYLETGLQLLGGASAPPQSAAHRALLERLAWVHFRQGQLDKALSVALFAIKDVSRDNVEDPITLASLYNTLGGIAWHQGRLKTAIEYVERSLELYDVLGYLYGTATAYGNLGILYQQQGQWFRAVNYFQQAHAIHRMIGNRQGQAVSLNNLGLLYLAMGNHQDAQQELETGRTIHHQLGDSWGIAQSQINLGHLALAQTQITEAVSRVKVGLSLARKVDSPEIQVEGLWLLALLYARQERLSAAVETAEAALAMAQKSGLSQKAMDCFRVLGHLRRRGEQFEQAEMLLQQALAEAQERDDPYQQGLVWHELGQLYQAQQSSEAAPALKTAADLFERLGATHQFQQVQAALSQLKEQR